MKNEKEAVKPNSIRRRYVNIIYFIDSSKTRSFRIPLIRFSIILSIFFIIVLWSFSSVFVGLLIFKDNVELKNRLSLARSTIFEYESRYDNVFEKAYNQQKEKDNISGESAPEIKLAENREEKPLTKAIEKLPKKPTSQEIVAKNSPPAEQTKISPPPIPDTVKNSEPQATSEQVKQSTETAEEKKPSLPLEEWLIVEKPEFEIFPDKLRLKIDIRNKAAPNKANGYLWAVATVQRKSDNKDDTWIDPGYLKIDTTGETKNPNKAYRFNIRRFKTEHLVFQIPPGFEGQVIKTKIFLMHNSGAKTVFSIPVNIAVKQEKKLSVSSKPTVTDTQDKTETKINEKQASDAKVTDEKNDAGASQSPTKDSNTDNEKTTN